MLDDAALLSRYVAQRDPEAFATLVERYAGMVHGACLRICGNAADADDAAQEAFLALARQAGLIRSSLPAWLHRVATRTALKLRRRRPLPLTSVPEPSAPSDDAAVWPEVAAQLDAALAELPERLRTALVLRFLHGRSQAEIAAELGLTQSAVSRRIDAGVAAIRRRLGGSIQAGALATALDGARSSGAPAELVSRLGRIALVGPAPIAPAARWPWALAAAAALVATFAWSWRPATQDARAVRASPPAPLADPPSAATGALLERPITLTTHGWQLEGICAMLSRQAGAGVETVPGLGDVDPPVAATIAADHTPLRLVLDTITRQTGWRWRQGGGCVLIDHAMDADLRATAVAALARPPSADGGAADAEAARVLADSGDADAWLDLLRALSDARLDDAQAPDAAARQAALLHALGTIPASLRTWEDRGNPLRALRDESDARAGAERAWRRALARRSPMTPYLCYLVGVMHLPSAVADLSALVERAQAYAADLDPAAPAQAAALAHLRLVAAWSLGEIGDRAAAPALARILASEGAAAPATVMSALARLGGDTALIRALPDPPSLFAQAHAYDALRRLGAIAPRVDVPPGWWEAFSSAPRAALAQRLFEIAPRSGEDPLRGAVMAAARSLPAPDVRPLIERRLADAHDPQELFALRLAAAANGDEQALDQAIVQARGDQEIPSYLLWEVLLDRDPRRFDAALEALLADGWRFYWHQYLWLDALRDPERATAAMIAKYPSMDEDLRTWVIGYLAEEAPRSGRDYLRRLLATDPLATLKRLASRRQRFAPGIADAIVPLLASADRAVAWSAATQLVRASWSRVSLSRALDWIDQQPIAELPAEVIVAMGPVGAWRDLPAPADEALWSRQCRLAMRWLREAPRPEVREAAARWISDWSSGEGRSQRQEMIRALMASLGGDPDESVRRRCGEALRAFLAPPVRVDDEREHALLMAGAEDDHDSLRRLDELRAAVQRALDQPPGGRKGADF